MSYAKPILLLAVSWLLLAGINPAWADNKLAAQVQANDTTLELCAEVALRALGIFKFGYGGLYLADCADYDKVTGDIPKQWSVLLTRDAKGKKLTEIAEESLEDNFSAEQLAGLEKVFSCMTDAYQDTDDGGQIDVRYLPDTGLQLWRNTELTADCGGDAEAAGYFRIWFGEDPFNSSMKERILEQASDQADKA